MGEVGVVFEGHVDGWWELKPDNELLLSSQKSYHPKSGLIPSYFLIGWFIDGPTSFVFVYFPLFGLICCPSVYIPGFPPMYSLVLFSQEILPSTTSVWLRLSGVLSVFTLLRGNLSGKFRLLLIFAGHSFKFRFIPLQFSLSKSQTTSISLPYPQFHDLTNHSRQKAQDDICQENFTFY